MRHFVWDILSETLLDFQTLWTCEVLRSFYRVEYVLAFAQKSFSILCLKGWQISYSLKCVLYVKPAPLCATLYNFQRSQNKSFSHDDNDNHFAISVENSSFSSDSKWIGPDAIHRAKISFLSQWSQSRKYHLWSSFQKRFLPTFRVCRCEFSSLWTGQALLYFEWNR